MNGNTPKFCEHKHQRETADTDLAICIECGRIACALNPSGEVELIILSIRWAGVPDGGGDDYTLRAPVKVFQYRTPSRNGHAKPEPGMVRVG